MENLYLALLSFKYVDIFKTVTKNIDSKVLLIIFLNFYHYLILFSVIIERFIPKYWYNFKCDYFCEKTSYSFVKS